jgi:DNA-binding NtrC family response regulator
VRAARFCSIMEHMEHKPEHTCPHCGLKPATSPNRRTAPGVICESAAMRALFNRVGRFAANDAPVVVSGESGTGKEVVARTLHANSPRADKPFVAINMAALPSELLESELFGHTRGAFPGAHQARAGLIEAAEGGTLFLDEVTEMPLQLQAKLLRALQEGEVRRVGETRAKAVDVRIVAATNKKLAQRVRDGQFREDLYYRLKVLSLEVPPLRERVDDVLPLARLFLGAERTAARRFSPAVCRLLERHAWPGNVRELQNAVKFAAALATDVTILPEHLPAPEADTPHAEDTTALRPLKEIEREHIERVLKACGGATGQAALALGIGRNTLWRKLQQGPNRA